MRDSENGYYIETPKTKSGYRKISMSEPVYQALKRVLKNRGKKPTITVDGYTGFLFLNRDGLPKVRINYNSMAKGLVKKYNKHHKEPLLNITMTLDYYTHVDACSVKAEMERLAA